MSGITLETLTPIVLDEEQKEKLNYSNYEELLDEVMTSNQYCNIALTGGYGAGKSTIMNTYEDSHSQYKSIHISLAKLNDEKMENVQAKLINQIIHQIDPKTIPQTKFKIKNVVSFKKVLSVTLVLFLFLLSFVYLCVVPSMQVEPDSKYSVYQIFWQHKENIAFLIMLVISFGLLLYLIVNAQLKRPLIKSIHMDKSQIELVDGEKEKNDEKEKFDKYMDEIIYLFEQSGIDILVIEDLDRFDDVNVFYELRQMNYLINRKLANKKRIKFIYMVKDKLFKESTERTKFFDVIIPIVPVMDNSNSYDLLRKMMGKEWLSRLDEAYLKMICMYIHDYRMLKNIFNEFRIYYSQLKIESHGYGATKLFAMITYKNLFPNDYADLQHGRGIVYKALMVVEDIRNDVINETDTKIANIRSEIKERQGEWVRNQDELDAIYLEEILYRNRTEPGYYEIDGKEEHSFGRRVEFINQLKKAKQIKWCYYRGGYYSLSSENVSENEIKQIFEALDANEEYASRKKRLSENCVKETSQLEKEIAEQEKLREHLKTAGIRKLTLTGVPQKLSCLFSKDMELIKIFVQDEMITKDYASYMTYFYPYSISEEELRYLNNVYARRNDAEQWGIIISHPEIVISYLKPEDWDSVALPNESLFKYIIQTKNENLGRIARNMKLHANETLAVAIMKSLDRREDVTLWVNELVQEWEDFLEEYIFFANGTKREIMDVMIIVLDVLEEEKVPIEPVDEYLHENENLLAEMCDERWMRALSKIHYKFDNIAVIPEELIGDIYASQFYRLNQQNVDYLLEMYYELTDSEQWKIRHFSTIMSNEEAPLCKYVVENLQEYIQQTYLPFYTEQAEEVDSLIMFLNHDGLRLESKRQLIEKMNAVITEIDMVSDERLRNQIVASKKMSFTRTNILYIWKDNEVITESLADFLKYHYRKAGCQLSFVFAKKYFNETDNEHPKAIKFINQMLKLEDMGRAYENLVQDVSIRFTALDTISWNKEQMSFIVNTRTIDMTEKNLSLMRSQQDKNLFYRWILNQIPRYIQLMKKEELREEEELQTLISSEKTGDAIKIECIRMCTSTIPIKESYNTSVVETIFKNELFDGNFVPIMRRYNSRRYGKEFMASLGARMVTYISDTINMHFAVPREILIYIMGHNSVTKANKKQLLAAQVVYQHLDTIQECLSLCAEQAFLDAFEGQNPKVDATEENRLLLEALVKKKWLSSYKVSGDKYIIYPKKKIPEGEEHKKEA